MIKLGDLLYNDLENNVKIIAKDYDASKNYLYDMSLNMASIPNATLGSFATATHAFTDYKGGIVNGNPTGSAQVSITNENALADAPYGITTGIKAEIKNNPASYSIKLNNFEVNSENYVALTFFVKNQLNKLYATDITVNVLDIFGTDKVERPAVAKISEVSDDWSRLTVLVKNNFDRVAYQNVSRYFDLEIVISSS